MLGYLLNTGERRFGKWSASLDGVWVLATLGEENADAKSRSGQVMGVKPMTASRSKVYVPKGLQFAVLQSVPALGLKACGIEIHEHVSRKTDRDLAVAQVYLTLKRLEARGLVTSDIATERPAGRRGQPRRIYRLSASGSRSLEAGLRLFGFPTAPQGVSADDEAAGALVPNTA